MSDVLAMPAIMLAGVIRMRLATFLTVSILSSVVKGILLFTAGYLLSSSISQQGIVQMMRLLSGACILTITILLFRYFYVKINGDGTKNEKK